MVLVSGCGIFETRDAEPPDQGGAPFIQPDRAELVLTNLQNAISSMNTQNYMRCLVSEGFSFTPSALAADNDPDIWPNWSLEDEETYFNNMRASTQNRTGHALQVQNEERTTLPDGGERITANYSITINHNRTGGGLPTVATGIFVIDLVRGEDGLWAIREWTDNAGGSSFTWSDFRATFLRD